MTLSKSFHFSQGSMQDYVECPRRFKLKYIDQHIWPALEAEQPSDNESYMQRGLAFHRLIQQYLMGISENKLIVIMENDSDLKRWWKSFLGSYNYLEGLNRPDAELYSEITLSIPLDEFRLIGKYDLLAKYQEKIIIYDWKTFKKIPRREWIANKLQTRVYPYILYKSRKSS